jgi:hypothetical protein
MEASRSRLVRLAARRRSLAKLLIALLVARIVTTIGEAIESRLTWWSLLVTALIALEAWRAWRVSRLGAAASQEDAAPAATPGDSGAERALAFLERVGPWVLYAFTAAFVAVFVGMSAADTSRDTLLDITVIAREALTLLFVVIVVLAYRTLRAGRAAD